MEREYVQQLVQTFGKRLRLTFDDATGQEALPDSMQLSLERLKRKEHERMAAVAASQEQENEDQKATCDRSAGSR